MRLLLPYFRACLFCGALFGRTDLLCGSCLKSARDLFAKNETFVGGYDYPVKTLFRWKKEELRSWKSELLLSLKGGGSCETLSVFALDFFNKHQCEVDKKTLFVPAPPRFLGTQDHAYCWASALATCSGGQVFTGLKREDFSEQKSKNLEGRRRQSFNRCEDFSKSQKVIFVDDLIASGSTANAAYLALGAPKSFEVWALADRPKLA